MDKISMRHFLVDLESRIDVMLKLWKKNQHIENGEAVQSHWQFEQAHILSNIFWHDEEERVKLYCFCARINWTNEFAGLTPDTVLKVIDRVGNFAQIIMSKRHGR